MREQLVCMTPGIRESVKALSACREPTTIIMTEKTTAENMSSIMNQVVLLARFSWLDSKNLLSTRQSYSNPSQTFIILLSFEVRREGLSQVVWLHLWPLGVCLSAENSQLFLPSLWSVPREEWPLYSRNVWSVRQWEVETGNNMTRLRPTNRIRQEKIFTFRLENWFEWRDW